jgi:hypothetical protein
MGGAQKTVFSEYKQKEQKIFALDYFIFSGLGFQIIGIKLSHTEDCHSQANGFGKESCAATKQWSSKS